MGGGAWRGGCGEGPPRGPFPLAADNTPSDKGGRDRGREIGGVEMSGSGYGPRDEWPPAAGSPGAEGGRGSAA
jgi:hypothetical protein